MDEVEAINELRASLPEFIPNEDDMAEPEGPLLHLVFGDLYRFYFDVLKGNQDLKARYWQAIERLAVQGSDEVENALGVSLIEHFSFDEPSRTRYNEAADLRGPATTAIGQAFGL